MSTWLKRFYGPSSREIHDPRLLYRGKFLHFFVRPNGWEYVQRPESGAGVAIVAVTTEDRLLLVEQWRPPLAKWVIELPSGLVDSGEDPAKTVAKELEEETGYVCTSIVRLCEGAHAPGFANEVNSLYRATGLKRVDEMDNGLTFEGDIIRHGHIHGLLGEGERIRVWEVPVNSVLPWLEKRMTESEDLIVDLRLYAGLLFAREQ